jgi:hypothetical protein
MKESIEADRRPLPGQLTFPQLEERPPETNSRYLKRAWKDGRAAALAGKSLLDEHDPPRRGYGKSIAAMAAHKHWCRVYRRWWRDGFMSVTLFPLRED